MADEAQPGDQRVVTAGAVRIQPQHIRLGAIRDCALVDAAIAGEAQLVEPIGDLADGQRYRGAAAGEGFDRNV